MNKNVLVIGLDGATWKVLNPLIKKNKIPFLAKLKQQSLFGISQSTLPPLTPSVWTSFLTGVNPGKHGIFGFLNYRKPSQEFFKQKDIKFEPINKQIKSFISFKDLDCLISIAGTETHKIVVDDLIVSAQEKIEKFKQFMSKNPNTQFSFLLFKEVDVAQHLFWGTKDLTEFYQKLDPLLEDLYNYYQKSSKAEKNFIVLSDHGFHKAAKIQFSIYPWLKEFLKRAANVDSNSQKKNLPSSVWRFIHSLNSSFKSLGLNITTFPLVKIMRNRLVVNLEQKKMSEFLREHGIRATFEGLYFYNSAVSKLNLIKSLKKIKYKNKSVFKVVSLSQNIYKGPFYDQGPDIVLMPIDSVHLNISPLETSVFSKYQTEIPADHMSDIDGIYMVNTKNKRLKKMAAKISIVDFRPLISDLLEIQKPFGLDGIPAIADYSQLDKKIVKAKAILSQAFKKYNIKNTAIAFTGRKDSLVTMHLLKQVCTEYKFTLPKILFIDHGQHFSQSYTFLKQIAKKWNLPIEWEKVQVTSGESLAESKIRAMDKFIGKHKLTALITAIRADESVARRSETFFSKRKTHTRVHPILNFTENDIWEYIKRFNLPYNPLYDMGYRSLEENKTTKKVNNYKLPERTGRDRKKEKTMESLRKLGYF